VIWAVVLAAGESRRMGRPKLLLPYGDRTIIEKVVANVASSRADGGVIVLGGNRRGIEEKLGAVAIKRVTNRRYKEGMFSSVRRGLSALPASAGAAVFVLADQPDVPASVIDRLIAAYRRENKGIVLPVYRKRRGHPLLIDLKYRREIESLSPEIGLRGLLSKHPDDILEVKVSCPGVLKDIDDPDDYGRALKAAQRQDRP
jgi:molybdenum cofactor cytidylyltransferase